MNTNQFPSMHVSFYVSNLENTISFYNTLFAKQPEKIKPGYAKYILEKPSLIISFVENAERVQSHFGHLGFQLETTEEVTAKMNVIKENKLTVREEMGVNCCYATQDKFWVNDPDGYQWEFYYFREDSEFNDPHLQTEIATACCTRATKKNRVVGLKPTTEIKTEVCCDEETCC